MPPQPIDDSAGIFVTTRDENVFRTMMGVSPTDMATALVEAGAQIVGANCGQGPETMVGIVKEIRAATDVPILIQANAGMPVEVNGQTCFPATPEMMAREVPALIAAGANIIGGCCGTTPAHIRAIAEAKDSALS